MVPLLATLISLSQLGAGAGYEYAPTVERMEFWGYGDHGWFSGTQSPTLALGYRRGIARDLELGVSGRLALLPSSYARTKGLTASASYPLAEAWRLGPLLSLDTVWWGAVPEACLASGPCFGLFRELSAGAALAWSMPAGERGELEVTATGTLGLVHRGREASRGDYRVASLNLCYWWTLREHD